MAASSDKEVALETAIARLARVAEGIAKMPPDKHAAAFGIAERTYLETAREAGYSEDQASNWVAAVMFRLRAEVKKRQNQ
jgi:hypothetical protein